MGLQAGLAEFFLDARPVFADIGGKIPQRAKLFFPHAQSIARPSFARVCAAKHAAGATVHPGVRSASTASLRSCRIVLSNGRKVNVSQSSRGELSRGSTIAFVPTCPQLPALRLIDVKWSEVGGRNINGRLAPLSLGRDEALQVASVMALRKLTSNLLR